MRGGRALLPDHSLGDARHGPHRRRRRNIGSCCCLAPWRGASCELDVVFWSCCGGEGQLSSIYLAWEGYKVEREGRCWEEDDDLQNRHMFDTIFSMGEAF